MWTTKLELTATVKMAMKRSTTLSGRVLFSAAIAQECMATMVTPLESTPTALAMTPGSAVTSDHNHQ